MRIPWLAPINPTTKATPTVTAKFPASQNISSLRGWGPQPFAGDSICRFISNKPVLMLSRASSIFFPNLKPYKAAMVMSIFSHNIFFGLNLAGCETHLSEAGVL